MQAKKADPDRLLLPIFRAFSNHLGIGDRTLRINDDTAKLMVYVKAQNAHCYETINPDELVAAGIVTIADAENYGGHAANRARDVLNRLGVPEARKRQITDGLPIIYRDQGRPYKIGKLGPNPWIFYWNLALEQWASIRPATMAEIKAASYGRVEDDEAEYYETRNANSGLRKVQSEAGPGRRPKVKPDNPLKSTSNGGYNPLEKNYLADAQDEAMEDSAY